MKLLQDNITFFDEFPGSDIMGFQKFNGKSKYRIFHDDDNNLEIINTMANLYDEMITWEYQNNYFIFTSIDQLKTFCSITNISLSIDYTNKLETSFLNFLTDSKILFSKITNKKIRKCQIWLAERLKMQWYNINVTFDNFTKISFSFVFNNNDYKIVI